MTNIVKNTTTSFRLPVWLKEFLNHKVNEIVYSNSSPSGIHKYTRTDLIIEAIKAYYASELQNGGMSNEH